MKQYFIRLDDASDYMDAGKWKKMEQLLDQFSVKPIFGIIPKNGDKDMLSIYERNLDFWDLVKYWTAKGWTPAMHGYEHKYITKKGGINPVNDRSEFAGQPYPVQAEKIRRGYAVLKEHGIEPEIFFAPAHTFDLQTLKALYKETPVRIINDTVADDIYYKRPFYFIPQQSGKARNLPFHTVTFCYHPNLMKDEDFENLGLFLKRHAARSISFNKCYLKKRRFSAYDRLLQNVYFMRRKRKEAMIKECTLKEESM